MSMELCVCGWGGEGPCPCPKRKAFDEWIRQQWQMPMLHQPIGWLCPKCGRGVAPGQNHCDHGGGSLPVGTWVTVSPGSTFQRAPDNS